MNEKRVRKRIRKKLLEYLKEETDAWVKNYIEKEIKEGRIKAEK